MTAVELPDASTARNRALWVFLLLGFLITVVIWQSFLRASASEAKVLFEGRSDSVATAIVQRMRDHEQVLLSSAGLFDASSSVTREEWHRYVMRLALGERYPGVLGVGFAQVIEPASLEQHIAAVRAEGYAFYRVMPEGAREFYTSIIYLEPFSGRNLAAFGYDMFAEPTRQRAMRRAVDDGNTAMTARVTLVQENQGSVQPGFLMYVPVYRRDEPVATAPQRWRALSGFVYSPFRMFDLMSAVIPQRDAVLDFALYDGDSAAASDLLFTSVANGNWVTGKFNTRRRLDLYGHHWTLVTTSRFAFDARFESGLHWMVLILGCALSVAVFLVLRGQVDARRQAESIAQEKTRALREVIRLNDSILSSAAFSIISTRADGVITSFNAAAERMLGYHAEELVGKQTPALIHLPDEVVLRAQEFSRELGIDIQPGFDVFVVHSKLKLHNEYEWSYVRKDGSTFPVLLSVTAMYDAGDVIAGYLGIAVDITERKRAQQALIEAREAAEAASRAKSEFLANMSHEIRTPLNAVLGLTRIVLGTELGHKQRDYLNKVMSSSTALLGILNDILDYSKIEAGRLELEQVDFELTDVLETTSALFSLRAEEKNINLYFEVDPALPTSLNGDPLRLGQVINNLVSNAIKFTDGGEVRVVVEKSLGEDHVETLQIAVCDAGIGMSAELIARLFNAFMQADNSTTRKYGGSGLGLSICQRLVRLMDGDIRVESELGVGSRFVFSIPLKPASRTTVGRAAILLKRMKVLLVCKQPAAADILKKILESWQFDVGEEAELDGVLSRLAAAAKTQTAFDLVIIDSSPSVSAAADIARCIRELEQCEKLAPHFVVMVATLSAREHFLHSQSLSHINGLVEKPVLSSQLYDLLMTLQQGRAQLPLGAASRRASRDMPAVCYRGERVLLVEDNALNQIVAREMLEQLGLSVDIAEDGLQSIEMARRECYRLILMDLHMPQMDGVAAAREIRAAEWGKTVPIVAMTAAAMQQDIEATRAAGMNAHIAKPVDLQELIDTLQRWMPPVVVAPAMPSEKMTANTAAPAEWMSVQQLKSLLPGVNVDAALTRLRKMSRYRDLLQSFQATYTVLRPELAALVEGLGDQAPGNDKRERLYRIAHDLKSVAGNIGFDALSVAAGELCSALQSDQPVIMDSAATLLAQLDHILGMLESIRWQ